MRGAQCPAHLPAGAGEGLPAGGDGDRALPHVGKGGETDVLPAVEHELLVHLIRDCRDLRMAQKNLRDGLELLESKDLQRERESVRLSTRVWSRSPCRWGCEGY